MKALSQKIHQADTLILTTHKQCDGDGLGAELAMYHALKKIGKDVRILNVDGTPQKYSFLNSDQIVQCYDGPISAIEPTDLALVFDTNDCRLIEPLYSVLKTHCNEVLFIDHHPPLKNGPQPTQSSWVNTQAASTGEIAFDLIKELGIELDRDICRAIYTSIAFDTQLFRLIRNSPRSHEIAAVLLKYDINSDEIHRRLFSDYTTEKVAFLSSMLSKIEYFSNKKLATLEITRQDFIKYDVKPEDSYDLVDIIMNIECLEGAVVFREEAPNEYKLSLRSKGLFHVHIIAEEFGGGGHKHASGAYTKGTYKDLRDSLIEKMLGLLNDKDQSA